MVPKNEQGPGDSLSGPAHVPTVGCGWCLEPMVRDVGARLYHDLCRAPASKWSREQWNERKAHGVSGWAVGWTRAQEDASNLLELDQDLDDAVRRASL